MIRWRPMCAGPCRRGRRATASHGCSLSRRASPDPSRPSVVDPDGGDDLGGSTRALTTMYAHAGNPSGRFMHGSYGKPTRRSAWNGHAACGFWRYEMLLNEYWDESYWPSCGRLRECTRVGYASAWRRHIRPELGDMDLADLTGPRIQSWLDSITSAGRRVRRGPYCGNAAFGGAARITGCGRDRRVTPPKPSGL